MHDSYYLVIHLVALRYDRREKVCLRQSDVKIYYSHCLTTGLTNL